VGPDLPLPDNLHGFISTISITLPDMEVKNGLTNVDEIFRKIQEKIVGIIRFWDLFKLSLPGRISVVKTLLLPQLNYLGCILTPLTAVLTDLQRTLDTFALKNLRVAAERKYIPTKLGGLGLINLETYLDAQKCSWISRASKNCIDN
jgi:hypothetical protein